MRSVYAKVLLWCFGTLVFSLASFAGISIYISIQNMGHGHFERLHALQLAEARVAYETGGAARLAAYLAKLDKYFGAQHFLTDPSGKDVVTHDDRSALLSRAQLRWGMPRTVNGQFVVSERSSDGLYRLIVIVRPPVDFWSFLPYYLPILLAVALLCWALAVNIASPLRELARTVERFGSGDLAARIHSRRRDEIGDLGRAFDRMAERIETLLTAERRLLQDISHELRSPLARLSFAAELTKTAEDRNAAAARLKKDIDRLTSLVGTLVEVTRVEGDPASRKLEEIALDRLLRELVEDCGYEADARGCRVRLDASPSPPIRGETELLRRAIENILRNAIRYAPEGSTIDVKLESAEAALRISVRDYGPGVPEESLHRIFEPFFRVDGSRDTATGGVGLGLAIAHRAIRLHHGELTASNAEPGLLVRMELPLKAGEFVATAP